MFHVITFYQYLFLLNLLDKIIERTEFNASIWPLKPENTTIYCDVDDRPFTAFFSIIIVVTITENLFPFKDKMLTTCCVNNWDTTFIVLRTNTSSLGCIFTNNSI